MLLATLVCLILVTLILFIERYALKKEGDRSKKIEKKIQILKRIFERKSLSSNQWAEYSDERIYEDPTL